jgi:hypothetical protein
MWTVDCALCRYINSARIGVGVCPQAAKPPLQPYGPDSCGTQPWTPVMVSERLGPFRCLFMLTCNVQPSSRHAAIRVLFTLYRVSTGFFKGLLANPRTTFRMMCMCCSGILTDIWCESHGINCCTIPPSHLHSLSSSLIFISTRHT